MRKEFLALSLISVAALDAGCMKKAAEYMDTQKHIDRPCSNKDIANLVDIYVQVLDKQGQLHDFGQPVVVDNLSEIDPPSKLCTKADGVDPKRYKFSVKVDNNRKLQHLEISAVGYRPLGFDVGKKDLRSRQHPILNQVYVTLVSESYKPESDKPEK